MRFRERAAQFIVYSWERRPLINHILAGETMSEIKAGARTCLGAIRSFPDSVGWRLNMAKRIASEIDAEKYGVKGMYLIGSTEMGIAGPGSDIDLIVHVESSPRQRSLLKEWFAGWDKALCAFNELITGLESPYLLDIHYVTARDIQSNECFASKIRSIHEPATPLRIGGDNPELSS